MQGMTTVHEWVTDVTKGASWRQIAATVGTTHATIQRRLENEPGATVLAIARAYGANPLPGLIAAGLLTERDVSTYARARNLSNYTDVDLAREVLRRVEQGAERSGALHATRFIGGGGA